MFADDRVLIAYVPTPRDFDLIVEQGWYRIPVKHAPKGIHAEWIAFYFGKRFGERKYAIHHVAYNAGHELVQRRTLIPAEPTHPRANDMYYKIVLGELQQLERPIISLRWRRLLFVHTTGDRFQAATEINDLLVKGDDFVNRAETVLRDEATRPYVILSHGTASNDSK